MKTEWREVSDKDVRCVWKCHICKDEGDVGPDFYSENGTPVCGVCDTDMTYVKTLIRVGV